MNEKTTAPDNVCIIEARIFYPHLFEPTKGMGANATPKYNANFGFPKTDKRTLDTLKKAFAAGLAIAKEKGKLPADTIFKLGEIVKDGDAPNKKGKQRGEEYKGMYFITAKSANRPGVAILNAKNKMVEATKPDDIYAGCYVKVQVAIYGFNNDGVGMACGLNHVLKIKDGKRLSGGAGDINDAFSEYASASEVEGFDDFDLEDEDDNIF